MYHRFDWVAGAADALAAQCAHLRRCYSPISLEAAAGHLEEGRPFPANAVTVTVDDGHADFERIALPIFRAHGIPVTLYLTTDFVDGTEWLWFDRIEHALRASTHLSFVDPLSGEELPLGTRAERRPSALRLPMSRWAFAGKALPLRRSSAEATAVSSQSGGMRCGGCRERGWRSARTPGRIRFCRGWQTAQHSKRRSSARRGGSRR
jgi:peptidoglycan/xylan/chitin deacetylase (PgdA/CDA1 family)